MLIKLSEILKQQGLFSQDIKARLKNKQISINGESISEDINIDCSIIKNTKKDATGQVSGLAPNQNPIGLYNHFIS